MIKARTADFMAKEFGATDDDLIDALSEMEPPYILGVISNLPPIGEVLVIQGYLLKIIAYATREEYLQQVTFLPAQLKNRISRRCTGFIKVVTD